MSSMHCSAKLLHVTVTLLASVGLPTFTLRVHRKLSVGRGSPSNFWTTLDYAKDVVVYSRGPIFKAACDSSAFTCEEIVLLASFDVVDWGPSQWTDTVLLFAKGRAKHGCISDPGNAKLIVDAFEKKWGRLWASQTNDLYVTNRAKLMQTFITDNDTLKPAQSVVSSPRRLQTGHRSDKDMFKLMLDVEQMMPDTFFYLPGGLLETAFMSWLRQVRTGGEQFSGPQLVSLVYALPSGFGLARAVSVLLDILEQYSTGVTCTEVNMIQRRMALYLSTEEFRIAGLAFLKSNIVDAQNKAAVVADRFVQQIGITMAERTENVLEDLVAGLPPKNNAVFGVVKGNPVIFVVDESKSMDVNFTLGDDIFTRRNFCHMQLEMVLKGLPNGTYFSVIQYESSAVKIFQSPVPVSKTNIDAAMNKVSSTWRQDYAPGHDPVEWLRRVHGFTLNFRHQFNGCTRNSMEALQLAYAMAGLPLRNPEDDQQAASHSITVKPQDSDQVMTKGHPHIYFLTSGQPDGGPGQILHKIDGFDDGRNIAVNTIAFSNASPDPSTKRFAKELASKTGGFFRSIEQA